MSFPDEITKMLKGMGEVREKQIVLELRLKPDHAIEILKLLEKLQNG